MLHEPRVRFFAAGAVECWLLEVEGAMKCAVHSLAREALTAYPKSPRTSWILQWPSQLVLNCSQVGRGTPFSQHYPCL